MKEFNPYDAEGRVKDPEIASILADAQKPYMDESKKTPFLFGDKKKKLIETGERIVDEELNSIIKNKNDEIYEKARWDSFRSATEIHFKHPLQNDKNVVYNTELIVKEDSDVFSFRFQDMIDAGLMKPEQLVALYEVKYEGDALVFTGKMKEGWKDQLEMILKKRILS